MTVAERYQKLALVKAALAEMSKHVPEIQQTARELEQVHELAELMQKWVSNGVNDHPATFNLGCFFLGVDAGDVRRALRI